MTGSGIGTIFEEFWYKNLIPWDITRWPCLPQGITRKGQTSRVITRSHIYHVLSPDTNIHHMLVPVERDNQALSRRRNIYYKLLRGINAYPEIKRDMIRYHTLLRQDLITAYYHKEVILLWGITGRKIATTYYERRVYYRVLQNRVMNYIP
jgi:hypothetical protein